MAYQVAKSRHASDGAEYQPEYVPEQRKGGNTIMMWIFNIFFGAAIYLVYKVFKIKPQP